MKCIILAAGYATRLYPLTKNFPKPLLEVKDKTIIDWLIDNIENTKYIDKYYVISNHTFFNKFIVWKSSKGDLASKIELIDDGTTSNETRLGAVADIELALNTINEKDDFLVVAGDNLLDFSLKCFIEYFYTKKSTCIMRYFEPEEERIKRSASVKFRKDDLVYEMIEKPTIVSSNWCVPPFYIYSKEDAKLVSEALKDGCNKDAPGSFISWLYGKRKVYTMKMPGKRYDIGNMQNYNEARKIYKGIVVK